MTVSLTHAYVSAIADSGDTSLIQPSNWNAQHTMSMAAGNLLGRATGAGSGAVSEIPIGVDAAGHVTLPAGTSSAAPFNLTSGTNLSTPTAGAMEYDGTSLYFTPTGQRGLVPGMQLYALVTDYQGSTTTSTQPFFNLTTGASVTANSYMFEICATLTKTSGTTSHTLGVYIGGTGTRFFTLYDVRSSIVNNTIGNYGTSTSETGVSSVIPGTTIVSGALTSANVTWSVIIKGIVSYQTNGFFQPYYQLSANPGSAYTTRTGSYVLLYPIGANTSTINIGSWA